jgi:hypothetical protein
MWKVNVNLQGEKSSDDALAGLSDYSCQSKNKVFY